MRRKENSNTGYRIFEIANYTTYTLFMLICIFPFYYIFINTISANNLVDRGLILFLPRQVHFNNYLEVLKLDRIGSAALISVARTVLGTVLSVLGSSYMGYLFSKRNMWRHKFWYRFVIITMYFSAGLIPSYLNIKMLGLMNTFWVYVIPGIFPVFYMILVKTFIEQIPSALEESAQIDGAGYFTRFMVIVMPLCIPILATIAVYICVDQWNGFMDTVLFISNYRLYTLQFLLYQYFQQADSIAKMIKSGVDVSLIDIKHVITPTSVRLTITVVITVPILFVYPFMQKYFIKGIMMGAIKG